MTNPAPLAARYTDPSPRSLRPVEESDFAPSNAERVLLTGASGMRPIKMLPKVLISAARQVAIITSWARRLM